MSVKYTDEHGVCIACGCLTHRFELTYDRFRCMSCSAAGFVGGDYPQPDECGGKAEYMKIKLLQRRVYDLQSRNKKLVSEKLILAYAMKKAITIIDEALKEVSPDDVPTT